MAIALLPSEIARLILNYLDEEGLKKTHALFLNECKYLEECKFYVARGIGIPKTIHGKKLEDFFRFDDTKVVETASIETQTDPVNVKLNVKGDESTYIKLFANNKEHKPKIDKKDSDNSFKNITISEPHDSLNDKSKTSPILKASAESKEDDVIVIRNNKTNVNDQTSKSRLLIGKNTERRPELSISTLNRQLDSIVTDASNLIKLQEEEEEKQKQQQALNYSLENKIQNETINCSNISVPNIQEDVDLSLLESSQSQVDSVNCVSNSIPIVLSDTGTNSIQQLHPVGTNNFLNSLGQINLNGINTATINGINGTIVPLLVNNNNNNSDNNINESNVPSKVTIKNPKNNIQIRPVTYVEKKIMPKTEAMTKENLFFGPVQAEKRRRGPLKREGPKNKRVFNRITPTIKQIIDKENGNEQICQPLTNTFIQHQSLIESETNNNEGFTNFLNVNNLNSNQIECIHNQSVLKQSESAEELFQLLGLKKNVMDIKN